MRTDDLDFPLPPELIAQEPPAVRGASRLLVYRRADRSIEHRTFGELPTLLRAGDALVFNDASVLPARFTLRKPTGGLVEGLFLEADGDHWHVLLKNLGPIRPGAPLEFVGDPRGATLRVLEKRGDEGYRAAVTHTRAAATDVLAGGAGRMPLPPYIRRDKGSDARDDLDRERYQTVFRNGLGDSVAAPTAGLHFDAPLLAALDAAGVSRATLTLAVGMGTFKPVTADRLEDHAMHAERYALPQPAAERINAARAAGGRVVAVGTTSARVLESQPAGPLTAATGETSIFIRPPHLWRHVDALVTNFHLPRSTLIALVAAMVGLEEVRRMYAVAVAERYRFFSYGDAMLIV